MAAILSPEHVHSIPANDARTASARDTRVEVVAITRDDALLEQIGQALDGESIIRHADTPAEARGIASPRQPCVMLLDSRGHEDLARIVDDLQSAEGSRVVLVFAPAESGDDVARAVRGSAAFAVLTMPLAPAQAAAVLAGACEETLARHALLTTPPAAREEPVPDVAVVVEAAPEPAPSPEIQKPRTRRADTGKAGNAGSTRTTPIVASLVVLALLAGGGTWYWQRTAAPTPTSHEEVMAAPPAVQPDAEALVEAAPPEALQSGSVDELLDSARAAMRARRYTDPEGQNALNYYLSVLAQEPDNGEAREGLERVAAVLRDRVQASVEQRRFDEASRTLAQLRSIRADDPAIARIEATVTAARKAELDRQQGDARAEQLAGLVSLRIRQGKLVDAGNDSAKHYLAQLRRLPGDAQQRAALATTELQQACLSRFKDALAKSQRAEADRWKAEARALGVSATEIAALQRDVTSRAAAVGESRQEVSRVAQMVQQRIADNRLLEPVGDSAVFHLNALRALDPASPAVASSERALSAKLVEQGRAALGAQRLDTARAHAAAARELGVNIDAVATLERDIAAAGSAAEQAGQKPVPKLVRTRYVAPEYPAAALKQRLQGTVRVGITVDAEGRVRDVAVTQANPPGVFDAAAVAAVRRWRFKPLGDEDSGLTATGSVEIAFRPEDMKQ